MTKNLNKNSIKELFAKYQPQLLSFIKRKGTKKEDAEDVLQDVFYQLTKTLNSASDPIENVSAWLYKVAQNTIINKGKKMKESELPYYSDDESDDYITQDFSEVLFNEDDNSPETEYLRSLVWVELEKALAELPEEQREVFELTELDGIPLKEISATTGVSVNTLLSRKHYAVKFLRKRLSGLYEELIYS